MISPRYFGENINTTHKIIMAPCRLNTLIDKHYPHHSLTAITASRSAPAPTEAPCFPQTSAVPKLQFLGSVRSFSSCIRNSRSTAVIMTGKGVKPTCRLNTYRSIHSFFSNSTSLVNINYPIPSPQSRPPGLHQHQLNLHSSRLYSSTSSSSLRLCSTSQSTMKRSYRSICMSRSTSDGQMTRPFGSSPPRGGRHLSKETG